MNCDGRRREILRLGGRGGGACRADGYDAVFQGLGSSSPSPILMTQTPPDRCADAGQFRLQLRSVLSGLQPF